MTKTAYSVLRIPFVRLLLLATFALALAYQFRAPIVLEMSSANEEIYLTRGFYRPEETFGVTYRWTSGAAQVTLPGVGSGVPFHLHTNLHEFRPAPLTPQPASISFNGHEIAPFTPAPSLLGYDFEVPANFDPGGEAVLNFQSDTFTPKQTLPSSTDDRPLGLFIDQIQIDYGPGLIIPPLIVWMLLIISVLAAYGFGRAVSWSTVVSFVSAILVLIAVLIGIIAFRTWTAHNSPWLAGTIVCAWLIVLRLKRPQPAISNQQSAIQNQKSEILFVFLAWRIALIIIPIVGADVGGTHKCSLDAQPQPLTSWTQAAFGAWYHCDAIWYGSIASDGYQYSGTRAPSNVAFFPGFPIINGAVSHVLSLPVEVSGPIVSTLLTLVACYLLYRLVQHETHDPDTAHRSVVYLLAFPAAYYLAIGYSEALYVVCGLAAFLWARQGRWWLSGGMACLAGLTRLHGALLIIPLGYEYLRQRGLRRIRLDAIGAFGGPIGVLAFMLFLNVQFGQPAGYFSPYFEIQTLFFKGIRAAAFPTFPGTTLANYLHGFLTGTPSTESVAVMGAMILLIVLTVDVWARLPRVYGVYMLTVTLFSLTGGDLISMPRFVVPMFPGFMAMALLGRRPWVDRAILITSLVLQGILALMFTKGYWIA